ncbi:SUKH-4 family immunity protein [Streptomyces sp. NPDC059687]|uniref:SUKH-4 family immunity protein n=1 Tax=unclassified Streptomyces TaxID=2593676 RepID=UPI0036A3F440
MVTHDGLTRWAGSGHVIRADPEVVARWRIPERMKALLIAVGVPVAPRLIERVVLQREDEPVLQTPRGPLYRLTEHADLGVPTERSSFGVEPETGAVYYVARDGAACFANSTVDLWLQTLHCYGGHVTASELLSEPDDPEEYFSEDEEERALAELSHLARALEEIDPAAFKGYTGFLWPGHLDRWLY